MPEKNISSRITHKHDTEANWNKINSFIPKAGEIIIYDKDDNVDYNRIKIGDGVTDINTLTLYHLTHTDTNIEEIYIHSILQSIYPIGAIYISTIPINPSQAFGFGEWEQIKDTFLLASGDIYAGGSTGGEATHALTLEEMPSHTHTYKRHAFDRNDTDPDLEEDVYGANNKTLDAREGVTGVSGNSQPHNNMPPYLAVYIYKRIG